MLQALGAMLLILGCGNQETSKSLTLATTTSARDSGLLDVLCPKFREQAEPDTPVVLTDDDHARFEIRRVYDALKAGGEPGARPEKLPEIWSWPPVIHRGPGWFRAELSTPEGRTLWIDGTGDTGFRSPTAGQSAAGHE